MRIKTNFSSSPLAYQFTTTTKRSEISPLFSFFFTHLEDVSALVVLDSPAVALEDLGDLLLPEDAEEPVHEDLEPHGDGVRAVEDQGGQLEDVVRVDGDDAGGGRGAVGVESAQGAEVGVAGRRRRRERGRVGGGERVAAGGRGGGCCGCGRGGAEVVAQAEFVESCKG